ncbi:MULTISPECIES: hypothetical protein [unclassified Sporolactobacillus]|uniref:hypothetical protein n=1 Tax=unclassified Sporolactobacillus TaxID=2628533 RepID=UPI00236828FE|nr:hypothetical protein [Sporolactobacillus sp. CQH2019]MDD9150441.1 hypothetical protein [Sporolactobacillus sp. CQH2019]
MGRSVLTINVDYEEYQQIDRDKRFLWQPDRLPVLVKHLPTSEKMGRLSVVFYCGVINSLRVFHIQRLVPHEKGVELQLN